MMKSRSQMTKRMITFRQRVRTRLAFLGLSHAALAEQLGMSRQQLQGWITRPDIKLSHVDRCAEALGVPTSFLVDLGGSAWAYLTNPAPEWVASQGT